MNILFFSVTFDFCKTVKLPLNLASCSIRSGSYLALAPSPHKGSALLDHVSLYLHQSAASQRLSLPPTITYLLLLRFAY